MPGSEKIKQELESRWMKLLKINSPVLSSNFLTGSTPPSVFVGTSGYPKVMVGPMIPPFTGNTSMLDLPEQWVGKEMNQIVDYRLSLIAGFQIMEIRSTMGRYVESLQEIAMASRPVDSEAIFDKPPTIDHFDTSRMGSTPFGAIGSINTFKISSQSVDDRIQKSFYDKDRTSLDAIFNLYRSGVEISKISRVLSLGMLGVGKKRKLVPTRWSITATDDTISKNLIGEICDCAAIDTIEVRKYFHYGNLYCVILIPDTVWKFEMIECWIDVNGNSEITSDSEIGCGRVHHGKNIYPDQYPSTAGAYFAARLAVVEHLAGRKRLACAIVIREIRPEYNIPLGVWQVREGVRAAMRSKQELFENLDKALLFACLNMVNKHELFKASKIYRDLKYQTRLSSFVSD